MATNKVNKSSQSKPAAVQVQPAAPAVTAPNAAVPVIGIGASAGGLEAFEQFFRACPADSGMAFVLIPHLDPGHDSLLAEILQRTTPMPVVETLDQVAIAANHVYIIPPNREMAILNGALQLSMPEQARGMRKPIDAFFCSLAEDQAEDAVGIVLSGTANDGTQGLRAILAAGGICMVQDPSTAKYDGMPQSAIASGYVTHILPVDKMPAKLLEITRHSVFRQRTLRILPAEAVSGLNQILLQVRSATGHDFSLYKKSTIGRRVERRMAQNNIEDLAVYARYLKQHPPEVKALFKELLINVTSFFRDPEAFVALKEEILPRLLADRPEDYVFRVWVAGCASGEEAYSIAMLLREFMDETRKEVRVQIYATDIDEKIIAVARSGSYPDGIAEDVTPERLRRFFTKDETGYKVRKNIREMVVFAVQSVIKDPPFTRLDLLSCRNLMIYLEPEQQVRLIPSFHYALKPGGVLFLSSSETITSHPELFTALNRKWKFYLAGQTPGATPLPEPGRSPLTHKADKGPDKVIIGKTRPGNIADLSNRVLLASYAPASVTTDVRGNILHVHGDTSRYLRPPPGPVTNNVVEMARESLQPDLRTALAAAAQGTPTLAREVLVKTDGGSVPVRFSVRLLPALPGGARSNEQTGENLLLVSFQDVATTVKPTGRRGRGKHAPGASDAAHFDNIERLEHELAYAKETLQAHSEEQQATNEELKSSNEELQSTNEELQSANEELETSKEELQSLNEETITVNAELNSKIDELIGIQNDVKNLLDNINVGTLFLDHHLVIRRYTREAQKVYRLIGSDVGRPLGDITSNIEGGNLTADLQGVLDTLIPSEREVRTTDGAWYLARIQPYRTLDNVIEGVVLTFAEVTDFKLASEAVQRSEAQLATAQEMAHLGSWELEIPQGDASALSTGRAHWSEEMFKIFGLPPADTPMSLADVMRSLGEEDRERATAALRNAVETRSPYDIEYRITRPDGRASDVRTRALPIADAAGRVTRVVGTALDITESRAAERLKLGVVQLARELAEGIVDTVSEPLIVLDGGLQVVSASRSFYAQFQVTPEETLGRKIYALGNGQWDIPALHELLENVLPHDHAFEGYAVEHDFPKLGARRMLLNARRIVTAVGSTELILLAIVANEPVGTP